MWHPDEFVEQMLNHMEEERRVWQDIPWCERRGQLRSRLEGLLGDFKEFPTAPFKPKLLERTELGGIVRERVEYNTAEGLRVPAYILSPKTEGRKPAILALHGHGWGSREMVGLLPNGRANTGVASGHGDAAIQLASRGFLVIVPEIIGFGDRNLARNVASENPKANSCFPLAAVLLLAGKTLAGLRVFEASRTIDYLLQRSDVDGRRLGITGFSGGGMVASLTAAMDERIRAAVICGYANTYRQSILARNHCLDNYIPGILKHAEMPELLALIAPRPLFIESGNDDHLFPEAGVRESVHHIAKIYQETGAKHQLDYDIFPGGHEMNGRRSFDWLQTVL